MKLKIIPNPDEEIYKSVTEAVKNNNNFCPCIITHTEASKCMCEDFRNQDVEGECHCSRFIKIAE